MARRVREYIENHLERPLLLADLAAQAGLSEYHFARMFKHATGLAPHQFVMRARLQRAERLLRHSQQPITEIALACGQLRQPFQQPLQGGLWICSAAGAAGALTGRESSMDQPFAGLGVLFVAGFGPITRESDESKAFYVGALGLPLKPMPGNETYLLAEQGALEGVKHFALWPLAQAAQSCFGDDRWPADLAVPQAWIEFDVADMAAATQGWSIAVIGCWSPTAKPWGQSVTRLLSPEGLLVGVTYTPAAVNATPFAAAAGGERLKNKYALA